MEYFMYCFNLILKNVLCINYEKLGEKKIDTFVCPNLYWLWSMSREASSFSAAFLLSTNLSSGMACGFRMR